MHSYVISLAEVIIKSFKVSGIPMDTDDSEGGDNHSKSKDGRGGSWRNTKNCMAYLWARKSDDSSNPFSDLNDK